MLTLTLRFCINSSEDRRKRMEPIIIESKSIVKNVVIKSVFNVILSFKGSDFQEHMFHSLK